MKTIDNVKNWQLADVENISVGDFNNVSDREKFGICPGQRGDSAFEIKNETAGDLKSIKRVDGDYKFICAKGGYFYGITNENTELIAIDKGESLIPVLEGAGGMLLSSREKKVLLEVGGVKDFVTGCEDGNETVTVYYNAGGANKLVREAMNKYIFRQNCISVEAYTDCIGLEEQPINCAFARKYLNTSPVVKKRVCYNWIYPENNDFAYRQVDALSTSEVFGDTAFYTFIRDENTTNKFYRLSAPTSRLPVVVPKDTVDLSYKYNFELVFTPACAKESYIALFSGRDSDFAAGIASIDKNDNSTMFVGKELALNINVTNISKRPIRYSVRYNIMDYYNNAVVSNIYYNNALSAGEAADHNINLTLEKYGMYYLNLYVSDGKKEYRECYPFAMLEDYKFTAREKSPFGIDAPHHETYDQATSTLSILDKLGVSGIRIGEAFDTKGFLERLKDYNVTDYFGGASCALNAESVDKFKENLKQTCETFIKGGKYFVMANETDSPYKANYDTSLKFLKECYIPYTYNVAYDYISKKYPDMLDKVIWQSNCHGTTEWLEAFHETGMWDNSEFIDIHSYSSPSGPDKVFSNKMESMYANTFSNEYAITRWKRLIRRYGEKRLVITETGYPTTPAFGDTTEIDIRTQADFNTRIALFFLEGKAESVYYYCMYDRTGALIGTSEWNEMYFGALYNYDYNGVYMPKPWAAAFANLTRRLDGYQECVHNEKYEEDEYGTLRAFDVKKENGEKLTVLWSNIYLQPNTTAKGRVNRVKRIPMLAWESRWKEKETRTFESDRDTVRVVDIMGNETVLKVENGKVEIEVSGSPIFVYGI